MEDIGEARKFAFRMLAIFFVALPLATVSLAVVAFILLPTWALLSLALVVWVVSTVAGIVVVLRIQRAKREAQRSN